MLTKCLFCEQDLERESEQPETFQISCLCLRCGEIHLTKKCCEDFMGERFSPYGKRIISIVLRNEYERWDCVPPEKVLTLADLHLMVNQYMPFDPLAKIDNALINIRKKSKYIGSEVDLLVDHDYPYYHCLKSEELLSILKLLYQEGFIDSPYYQHNEYSGAEMISITVKGYQRLREIMKPGKDSKQCFVAMWFKPEMNEVYEKAIKSAIEFKEKGKSSPRFEVIKIDNVEHTNDINDEIIAQIRRSRFMVCDLTGYRGGVYFEAGFAYGLGLEIIYTCREDWCKEQVLKDGNNKEVHFLFDDKKNRIEIKKEGVHFDLAHRNRIEWSPDNLEDFRIKLENRIKAVII